MIRKKLPIGTSDFAELIEKDYYFIDKSLFIKEILDSGAKVTLLPRPRRFGKTVNMSMVQHFFEKTHSISAHPECFPNGKMYRREDERNLSNRELFKDLKIAQHPECMAKQGQYPVISMTLKDVKDKSWVACEKSIKSIIAEEFRRHNYLLASPILDDIQKKEFLCIVDKSADISAYKEALARLSAYLYRYHDKQIILLIDEYDAPIHAAVEYNYYDDIVDFMRGFLSGGFKDNSNLEFGLLTGILRIAKESIFSGLNNLLVSTLLDEKYSDKFGLLEHEVRELLETFGLEDKISDVRTWYDGYQSGPHKIYNPWSILNFVYRDGVFKPYWVNTSGNVLLKQIMRQSEAHVKEDFEQLIRNIPLTKTIDETVVMPEIYTNESATWNLLLMSGYLTFENYRPDPTFEGSFIAELKIPNTEIAWTYKAQVLSWFEGGKIVHKYTSMLQSLINGKIDDFKKLFSQFSIETLSSFDATGTNPEKFYHGLVLGMLASLRDSHEVISNRESGLGRYDVSIFPRDTKKPGIIIEFKVVDKYENETLELAAQNAIKQINDRQYETIMHTRGITTVIKIGIAFEGKKNLILIG